MINKWLTDMGQGAVVVWTEKFEIKNLYQKVLGGAF